MTGSPPAIDTERSSQPQQEELRREESNDGSFSSMEKVTTRSTSSSSSRATVSSTQGSSNSDSNGSDHGGQCQQDDADSCIYQEKRKVEGIRAEQNTQFPNSLRATSPTSFSTSPMDLEKEREKQMRNSFLLQRQSQSQSQLDATTTLPAEDIEKERERQMRKEFLQASNQRSLQLQPDNELGSNPRQNSDDEEKKRERQLRRDFLQDRSSHSNHQHHQQKHPHVPMPKPQQQQFVENNEAISKVKKNKTPRRLDNFLQQTRRSVTGGSLRHVNSSSSENNHDGASVEGRNSVAQTVADPNLLATEERVKQFRKEFLEAQMNSQRSANHNTNTNVNVNGSPRNVVTPENTPSSDKDRERQFRKAFLQESQQLTPQFHCDHNETTKSQPTTSDDRNQNNSYTITEKEWERQYRKDFLQVSQGNVQQHSSHNDETSPPRSVDDPKAQERNMRKSMIRAASQPANTPAVGASASMMNTMESSLSRDPKEQERMSRKTMLQTFNPSGTVPATSVFPMDPKEQAKQVRNELLRPTSQHSLLKTTDQVMSRRSSHNDEKKRKKRKKKRRSRLGDFFDHATNGGDASSTDGTSVVSGDGMSSVGGSSAIKSLQTVADVNLDAAKEREKQMRKSFLQHESQKSLQVDSHHSERPTLDGRTSRRKKTKKRSSRRSLGTFLEQEQPPAGAPLPARNDAATQDGHSVGSIDYKSSQTVAEDTMTAAKERERQMRKSYIQQVSTSSIHGIHDSREARELRKMADADRVPSRGAATSVSHAILGPAASVPSTTDAAKEQEKQMRKSYMHASSTKDIQQNSREEREARKMAQEGGSTESSSRVGAVAISPASAEFSATRTASAGAQNDSSSATVVLKETKENEKMAKDGSRPAFVASTSHSNAKSSTDLMIQRSQELNERNSRVFEEQLLQNIRHRDGRIHERMDHAAPSDAQTMDTSEYDVMDLVAERAAAAHHDITVSYHGSSLRDDSGLRASVVADDPRLLNRAVFSQIGSQEEYESDSEYETDCSSYTSGSPSGSSGSCYTDSGSEGEEDFETIKERERQKLLCNPGFGFNRPHEVVPVYNSQAVFYGGQPGKALPYGPESCDLPKYDDERASDLGSGDSTQIYKGADVESQDAMLPGAYSRTPGAVTRQPTISFSLIGDNTVHNENDACLPTLFESDDRSVGTASMGSCSQDSVQKKIAAVAGDNKGLVEARAVEEDDFDGEGVVEAAPIDLEAKEKKEQERKRMTARCKIVSVVAILLGAAVVALAVVFGRPAPKVKLADKVPAPTATPTAAPTPQPTTPCCFMDVPNFTLNAMDDPFSPQSKAWDWIYEDIMASNSSSNYTEARKLQRFALATLFYATGGENWKEKTGWLDVDTHECEWFYRGDHSPCKNANETGGAYTEILLYDTRLVGTIPPEVSLLTSLTGIDFQRNQLYGAIPSEIGTLPHLQFLALGANGMTGTVPLEIYNITTLRGLGLQANTFSGSLPTTELGQLTNLEEFWLANNGVFGGSIPSEIGLLTSMSILALNHNQMNGTLPTEVGQLIRLEQIWIDGNALTGSLPSEMGLLEGLNNMTMSYNYFSQSIPTEIGQLTGLVWLRLFNNSLSGPIPSEIGNLSKLFVLSLSYNRFSESIPSQLWHLSSLGELRMAENELTGTLPPAVGDMSSLYALSVFTNHLSQTLPTELGKLRRLEELRVGYNLFTGTLPSEIGSLRSLFALDVAQCYFSGSIPNAFVDLGALQELWLFQNTLSGPLPSELGSLHQLTDLKLDQNLFNSRVPSELGLLDNLKSLSFSKNNLVGPVPREFGRLVNLKVLSMGENSLTGSVPSEICLLLSLEGISAYQNVLSGTLPKEIGELTLLRELVLAQNKLTGDIPPSLFAVTTLQNLRFDDNAFDGSIPTSIGILQNLNTFVVSNNHFQGALPTEIGLLGKLQVFAANQNVLSGPIPSQLGLLPVVQVFYAENNFLNGSLPSELSNATTLVDVKLAFNQLTGTIPEEYSRLTNLKRLAINDNDMTGAVPADVCTLGLSGEMRVDCNKVSCDCGCGCGA